MTPEQRLDRTERLLMLMARAGRRARREWNEKVNMLINAHIAVEESLSAAGKKIDEAGVQIEKAGVEIKGLAVGQARLDKEMAELAKSQKLTQQAFREYLKRGNGET